VKSAQNDEKNKFMRVFLFKNSRVWKKIMDSGGNAEFSVFRFQFRFHETENPRPETSFAPPAFRTPSGRSAVEL